MIEGKVIKYKDNVDTDVIIPARYLNTSDPKELASHCMEDLDSQFNVKNQGEIHNCSRKKFWMWFFKRTCTNSYKGSRSWMRNCRKFCKNFL